VSERRLRILTGCTAVGKTEAALEWAERRGAEILSCDSLLFYRGMDIGTAKPTPAERQRVPHHLIDVLPVAEAMDIARYAPAALACAEEIAARGRPVLVVGGSGFYLQSFLRPVADDVRVPAELRAEVAALIAREGLAAAVVRLRTLNPDGLGALDTANPRRVSRALERCLAAGKTLAQLAQAFAAQPPVFAGWDVELFELTLPPAELERRIERRAAAMLAAGLVEEVKRLRSEGIERNPSAVRAIGYRETLAMLGGAVSPGALGAVIAASTRALVKKQRTWFRTQLAAHPSGSAQDFKLMW
jgi:tRNA dimethylallyltransferase